MLKKTCEISSNKTISCMGSSLYSCVCVAARQSGRYAPMIDDQGTNQRRRTGAVTSRQVTLWFMLPLDSRYLPARRQAARPGLTSACTNVPRGDKRHPRRLAVAVEWPLSSSLASSFPSSQTVARYWRISSLISAAVYPGVWLCLHKAGWKATFQ